MIAVDWGTSQLRAYRLDEQGKVLEARERPEGILAVPPGGFPKVLDAITEGWEGAADRVLMSGMVGSRQGWREIPYVECPADVETIAKGVLPVEWRARSTVLICPGLVHRGDDSVPDVMRGEEVQVMGALALGQGESIGSILMAGTHSKHVRVAGGRIVDFATHMTGEVFAVLKGHSILGRMMEDGADDPYAFQRGVSRSGEGSGLLHHLFGVRTRVLLGEMPASAVADYLSGLLIGHTLRSAAVTAPVLIIGAPAVAERYRRACDQLGVAARTMASEEATLAGLAAIERLLRKG